MAAVCSDCIAEAAVQQLTYWMGPGCAACMLLCLLQHHRRHRRWPA